MKKNKNLKFFIILIILFVGVGFAYLSTSPAFSGFVSLKKYNFDVYFTNIQVTSGSVSASLPTITNKTRVSYSVVLTKPGDFYEFTVDVVNEGDLTAEIDDIIQSELGQDVTNLFDFTVEHANGDSIEEKELLYSGDTDTYRIILTYKKDIQANDLPTEIVDLHLSFEVKYIPSNEIRYVPVESYVFDYTGKEETFTVPVDGNYRIELWGAQGGTGAINNRTYYGGKGSYTKGNIELTKGTELYIYVGGAGSNHAYNTSQLSDGGWNGGGAGGDDKSSSSDSDSGGGGGGATDVSILYGAVTYNSTNKIYTRNQESYASRIMVAAGGGGGNWDTVNPGRGANGGGLSIKGYPLYHGTTSYNVSSGTQTSGYAFGYADSGSLMVYADAKAGGGGGYYTGVNPSTGGQGAGGTSYISGHTGCIAIKSATNLSPRLDSNQNTCVDGTVDIECSKHYSNYVFTDTKMIDGSGYEWTTTSSNSAVGMPTTDGTGTETGHSGNGYAKITYLG